MALRKSLHVRALGSTHSFGIDQFKKSAEAPVKLVDLTTNFGQAGVRQWISNPSVKGLFLAPPCGACSLARSIILRDKLGRRINAPKPLRSECYPERLPRLSAGRQTPSFCSKQVVLLCPGRCRNCIPMNQAGIIPSSAFLAVPRMRHVSIEAGIRAVGAQAWQCCRHLRVVRMPSTVVCIEENTFRGCHLLNSITVPGCIEFGYKAFAGCCSLQWIHANGGGPTTLEAQPNLDTTFSRRAAVTLPEFSFCFSKNVLYPELEPISLRNGPRHLRLLAGGGPFNSTLARLGVNGNTSVFSSSSPQQ